MAEADLFSGMKKVKKAKKKVDFDDLEPSAPIEPVEAPKSQLDPVVPLQDDADLTLKTGDDLDLSDLKKKKKKAKVAISLEEVDAPVEQVAATNGTSNADTETTKDETTTTAFDDFSDLKKKKKGKKAAFDLEAFEKELAAVESSEAAAKEGATGNASDDDVPVGADNEDDIVPDGEDPFSKEGEEGVKSKAELAYDKKGWIKESRDYLYPELLGRFYSLLYASHPALSGAAKKRYTIPPPQMARDGNKRSVFANITDICKKMRRQPEHVIQFLFAELGTTGSVDGASRLIIKGRFQQKHIENVLRKYIVEYVTCKTCKSPDTLLEKDNRIYFVTCQSCQSRRSVASISSGFKAITGKRKAQAA